MIHFSVRITDVNPVHTRFDLFQGTGPDDHPEYMLHQLTRGLSGNLCVATEALPEIITRLRPVQITHNNRVVITEQWTDEYLTDWLLRMPYD